MYFEDLSSYRYCLDAPPFLCNVLNIGWLDSSHPFTVGELAPSVVSKLARLVARAYPNVDVHVNRMRCIHPCNLCGEELIQLGSYHGKPDFFGVSEIWIPADDLWYAAPSMVVHYIETHRYLPPAEFVAAVEGLRVSEPYSAQDIYDRLMKQRMQLGRL